MKIKIWLRDGKDIMIGNIDKKELDEFIGALFIEINKAKFIRIDNIIIQSSEIAFIKAE